MTGSDFSVALPGAMGMLRAMTRMRPLLLALLLFGLTPVSGARADCTDPPGPEVNWRRCVFDRLALQGVDLSGAELRDASFLRADVSEATLVGVKAFRAKFISTDLSGAELTGADLREADMTKADLREANLVDADLRRARLFDADLRGADLTGAKLEGADLFGANLGGATWTNGNHVCREGSVGRCN